MNTQLTAHIAALKAKRAAGVAIDKTSDDAIIFWGTSQDKVYLTYLKPCVGGVTTFLRTDEISNLTTLKIVCGQKKTNRVISTSIPLLRLLLSWDKKKAPSLADYAGSFFSIPTMDNSARIEIVFIQPLKQIATVSYGRFMATRLITKLTKPELWFTPTKFTGFTMIKPENEASLFSTFSQANLICIDVETLRDYAQIKCLSYTAFYLDNALGQWTSTSVELALDSEYALAIMRKWNAKLTAPKIMQNGKYDIAYFARYSAPVYNYLYDTAHLFHCWYSELPKDLGFLNAFFIREAVYWKDLADTNDLHEYYRYNCLDTWGTGNCFLAMILAAPEYAINNYLLEFPLVFPCHLSEMTGIARDMTKLSAAKALQADIIKKASASLDVILGVPVGTSFNVNSPIQMKALLRILGCADLASADEKSLKKARFRHPFNARIINLVITVRKARKLVSTYLTEGKEFTVMEPREGKQPSPRILYSLNPHGTDTSRLASREHAFWCGLNVQNIPRGPAVKQTLKADPGFYFCEVDLEQAESRDTGYISGDEALIHNVEFSPDFHCANAAAFFGKSFEELFDVATGKVLDKALRQLAKPVNHGANYNMGAYVLIDTMGEENILLAKALLNLPRRWSYLEVASYLLEQFHKAYPNIKKVFYAGVIEEITLTKKLSSKAIHWDWAAGKEFKANPTELREEAVKLYAEYAGKAWVRYCFGNPNDSKSALNAYVAHSPQSLNAQTLNKAYMSVFRDVAINPQHRANIKLNAQIHDSILFQYRIGHSYLIDMIVERMEVPVTIKAYDDKIRTFIVPAGAKSGKHLAKGYAEYWSENE